MKIQRGNSGYLPGLDGWRTLAIAGVFMTHDLPWRFGGHSNAAFKGFGGCGVQLFFAISGFLICTRILEDEVLTGRFHLKSFYVRRVFRIQPASLTYLATILVLMLAGIVHESLHYWCGALLLYANSLYRYSDRSGTGALTGHFWTLSVEEHFYILLSLLLFTFKRFRITIFVGLFLFLWFARRWAFHHGFYSADTSSRQTFWTIQLLLFPATVALLLRNETTRLLATRFLFPWVAFIGTFAVLCLQRWNAVPVFTPFWSWQIISGSVDYLFYGFTFWVVSTTLHPSSLSTRFLEWAPLRYIGRLSYSLYLWHVLFFVPVYSEVGITSRTLLFLSQRPQKYIATLLAAMLSYYLIEKPLVRLGHRMAPPATPGHQDLATPQLQGS